MSDAIYIRIGIEKILDEVFSNGFITSVGTVSPAAHAPDVADLMQHLKRLGHWISALELSLWYDFHVIQSQLDAAVSATTSSEASTSNKNHSKDGVERSAFSVAPTLSAAIHCIVKEFQGAEETKEGDDALNKKSKTSGKDGDSHDKEKEKV